MWDVFLNGGVAGVALLVLWLQMKSNEKAMNKQQDAYTSILKDFIQSIVDEMAATTDAVKELTAEIRREK